MTDRVEWCERHRPNGGRTACLLCACEEMSRALAQISKHVDPNAEPYDADVLCAYDLDCDPQRVVDMVLAAMPRPVSPKLTTTNCAACYECLNDPSLGIRNPVLSRMILCPKCGNKRCPRATQHERPCSGSNEPGQKGSRYQ